MEKQSNLNAFNIRVYGIILKNKEILTLHETYVGQKLIKFPGGGLEFGEGTVDCLKRELMEELSIEVENIQHFYTQEDFLISKFRENEQLLTIYYTSDFSPSSKIKIKEPNIDNVEWLNLDKMQNPFTLPIDKVVYEKLIQHYL